MSSPVYNVYRVEYRLGLQDPMIGSETRYHNVIFVETDANGGGRILQVEGSIGDVDGMTFGEKAGRKPEESETYFRKHFLGQIQVSDYENIVRLLQTIPPPPPSEEFQLCYKGDRAM